MLIVEKIMEYAKEINNTISASRLDEKICVKVCGSFSSDALIILCYCNDINQILNFVSKLRHISYFDIQKNVNNKNPVFSLTRTYPIISLDNIDTKRQK